MASLLHVAVGVAGGRLMASRRDLRSSILGAALSMLPDADVVAFTFGIPYAHPLGHRGASHSIAFAFICGLVAWGWIRLRGGQPWRWSAVVTLLVLSHPLLDMLTTGGQGVALWWPLSDERIFAPLRIIPVAPIGLGMWSERGLHVVLWELVPSLPLVAWAVWPGWLPGERTVSRSRSGASEP